MRLKLLKLSKTSWIILGIGLFAIVAASLGTAHLSQAKAKQQLEQDLSTAAHRLDEVNLYELSLTKDELQNELNQLYAELENNNLVITQPMDSITASDYLLQKADICGVTITEISSSHFMNDSLGDIDCSVLSLTISVEGDGNNILSYIYKLNTDFATGMVESATVNITDSSSADPSTAQIQMLIYIYKGE